MKKPFKKTSEEPFYTRPNSLASKVFLLYKFCLKTVKSKKRHLHSESCKKTVVRYMVTKLRSICLLSTVLLFPSVFLVRGNVMYSFEKTAVMSIYDNWKKFSSNVRWQYLFGNRFKWNCSS